MSLIPKIELNKESNQGFDYSKMFAKCFIDLNKEISAPPVVLGIGYNDYKGRSHINPTFTRGEMSAIIAPQKSKKTMFKTALAAGYIGGNTNNYFPSLVSCRKEDLYVLDFDTEQGEYYAQRSFKRVEEMVGARYDNYLAFGLKKLTDEERVLFIGAVINDPKYKNKIGMVFIDGVADLCSNTNDIEKSNKVCQEIMKWNEHCHICCVIHKTFEKDRGTGHLGSFVQKKAETTIFLQTLDPTVKNSPIEVKQYDYRGSPFDTFYFDLDIETVIPKECSNNESWK